MIGFSFTCQSQTNIAVNFQYGKQKLRLNRTYKLNESAEFQLTVLRFYMMNVIVYSNGSKQSIVEDSKLIDMEKMNLLTVEHQIENIDSVSFLLGTSYQANTSGVLEGDLDPINGMYWAWNSGYINFKAEGFKVVNSLKSNFEFHLGGYENENATAREIVLIPRKKSKKEISIDLESYFTNSLLTENVSILMPGKDAVEMMNELAKTLNE